ncbi:hypothetical protein, unlikely [Trypanosoma congolense IL3000]|uniref:Uncharacterized protein n=1 Tax=Trypanosoma congolense (strain IL3000) TaxID=1068625 RepID=F9W419_TRYCI|nr:hypothetical protein, unlikely [Trypanosoma congolense IL3000]CCD15013.1 hypothetical protein, unlikely [Trypanosoma congolense IL3000]CCD16920.1 hypothetical protein, unlikely [Trypanosoma congolense IL3000]
MEECGAMVGEQQQMVKRYEFIGVLFDHDTQTVSLSEKMIRRVGESPPLEEATIEQMECVVSRLICAAGVREESLFPCYFFLKMVRRRLSRLNRGLARPSDPAALPGQALILANMWMNRLLKNRPVTPPQNLPTTAALVTDASIQG